MLRGTNLDKPDTALWRIITGCALMLLSAGTLAQISQPFVQTASGGADHIAYSPDGRIFVTSKYFGDTVLWDARSLRELRTIHAAGRVEIGGNRLLIDDKNTQIFDLDSGKKLLEFDHRSCADLSPDGQYVALCLYSSQGLAEGVYSATSGTLVTLLPAPIEKMRFDPSSRMVAALSALAEIGPGQRFVREGIGLAIFGAQKADKLLDLKVTDNPNALGDAVVFSNDGQYVAVATSDAMLRIYRVSDGRKVQEFKEFDIPQHVAFSFTSIAFSPNDDHIVACSGSDSNDETLRTRASQWEIASGRKTALPTSFCNAVAFAPDRSAVAVSGPDPVGFFDPDTWQPSATLGFPRANVMEEAVLSPDGSLLIGHGSSQTGVTTWQVGTGREVSRSQLNPWASSGVGLNRDDFTGAGDLRVSLHDQSPGYLNLRDMNARRIEKPGVECGIASFSDIKHSRVLCTGSGFDGLNKLSLFEIPAWKRIDGIDSYPSSSHFALSPEGTAAAIAFTDMHTYKVQVDLWTFGEHKSSWSQSVHGVVNALRFTPDGRMLAVSAGEELVVLDTADGHEIAKLGTHGCAFALDISPDGQSLACMNAVWDLRTMQESLSLENPAYTDYVNFSADGTYIVTGGEQSIRLWNKASGELVASFFDFGDAGSVVMLPNGYFLSSKPSAEQHVLVRTGPNLLDVTGVDALREKFYRPDLVRAALSGVSLPSTLSTLADIKHAPDISLVGVPERTSSNSLDLQVRVVDRGGGVGDVRVFVNGAAVAQQNGRDLGIASVGDTRMLRIGLVPGRNEIAVVAFNSDGTMHSDPARAIIAADFQHRPQLHALVVGIDKFENPSLDLKYSVADASAIAQALQKKASPLFERVDVELLTSPQETTKTSLEAAFARYKNIPADDVFLFYVASHGTVDGELASKQYFLIPSNVGLTSVEALQRDALNQDELKQMIGNIPATKKFLLLDTCHSGALGSALLNRGLDEQDAIDVLSGAVGSTVLAAATSQQQALEGQEGHGVFTWVLLQGLDGKADTGKHGFITTLDLASYVGYEVPRVAEQVFKQKQFPDLNNVGQAFPIVSSRP